jgi:hypothetical protein
LIPVKELAEAIHPYRLSRRYVLIFTFHCDISYDGSPDGNAKGKRHDPRTYVFAGFFSSASTWVNVENAWIEINKKYDVPRFHAAHLNSKTYEYQGWDDPRKIEYSAELLDVIHQQGERMYGVTCGMFADEYRAIISDKGRRKMGSPYLACFNSCIARVARMMDQPGPGNIEPDDKFAVLIDQDDGYLDAIDSFNKMRRNLDFPHRSRLATCTGVNMDELVAMQPADLIAYETFKRLHAQRNGKGEVRHVLKSLMKNNIVNETYMGSVTLKNMKAQIESTPAGNGQLVIIPQS